LVFWQVEEVQIGNIACTNLVPGEKQRVFQFSLDQNLKDEMLDERHNVAVVALKNQETLVLDLTAVQYGCFSKHLSPKCKFPVVFSSTKTVSELKYIKPVQSWGQDGCCEGLEAMPIMWRTQVLNNPDIVGNSETMKAQQTIFNQIF
jgi:hypothetical protein